MQDSIYHMTPKSHFISKFCTKTSRQLLFLNQRKKENGRRNVFMTKFPRKNVPDVGIELGAACMRSSYRARFRTFVKSFKTLLNSFPGSFVWSKGDNQIRKYVFCMTH